MHKESDCAVPASRRRRVRRRVVLIVIAALIAALLAYGERRVHTGYASGHSLHGRTQTVPADKTTIRFATFNIHGGKGRDRVRSLDRIAGCLKGFDVIGLNEVHGALHLFSDRDQAKVLGETMDLAWLFAPTEYRWWRDHFGNGILSNLPVTKWQRIPLAGTRRKGHRNVLLAVIPVHGQKLRVLITHLTLLKTRKDQLKTVLEMFLDIDPPVVLMGDLNTPPTDPQIVSLLSTPGVVEPLNEVLRDQAPTRRVDWIFARGLEAVDAGIFDRGASDHPCVWAELRLTPQPTRDSTINRPD
jgi:endonuclease/exonuclease/phosphatase family metal-dependent hydrolase